MLSIIDFIFYHTPVFYLIQSLWRDEAFSYFMAKPDIITIIKNTATDFNPPLYYLLLHFWIKIAGNSDSILRLLSFIFHLIGVYFAYLLGRKIYSKRFAFFVALFTFLNPMLLYYGMEIRMYSLYAMFTFISLYFFHTKRWKWYTISTVLGLYTHTFFVIVPISFAIYYLFLKQLNRKNIMSLFFPVIFFLPWIPIVINQFLRSKNSWLFPVDLQLVTSVIGNLFTSFEGTPGQWWSLTALLSIILIIFFINGLKKKKLALLFLTPIFFPLLMILGYSVIMRPIYVNRYAIFITVFEIFAVTMGIWCIKNTRVRIVVSAFWIIYVILFNIAIVPYKKKTDFKTTFFEINKLANDEDFVYAKTPIGFLESAYYSKNLNKVFVYNPDNIEIPNYIGVTVLFPNVSKQSFPLKSRTFLVLDDANYEMIINK
jgi:mannosyltransferase